MLFGLAPASEGMDSRDGQPAADETSVSAETRHAQMAEGLFHRFRDVMLAMERRDSFVWSDDSVGGNDLDWMDRRPPGER